MENAVNQITDQPNKYTFGLSFNYKNWPKGTQLTLTNVRWNQDYRDIVRFSSQGALDSWIDSKPKLTIDHASAKRFQRMKVSINTPFNEAMQYNYLRARNPYNGSLKSGGATYYYFILDYAQISGNNTELTLQLDEWQTFGYDVTFGNCFVERGHMSIANTHAFDNYGRDYLNIPEGLDVGGEYRIVKTAKQSIMSLSTYSVLVCSTIDLTKNPGTVKAPKQTTASGGIVDGITTGASFYVFPDPGDFRKFMKEYQNFSWITEGIISATIIPDVTRYHAGLGDNVASDVYNAVQLPSGGVTVVSPPDFEMYNYPSSGSAIKSVPLANNWRDSFMSDVGIPNEYRMLKKLLTYPYSVIELTTWSGSPLIIRPEAWADDDATIREQAVMLPPAQRIAFMPYRYNADSSTTGDPNGDDNGEDLDFATVLDNFPAVPVVNNMYLAYLAQNAHGIQFQFAAADWAQTKALRGADATAAVAGADIRNTGRQAGAGITAMGAQAQLDMESQNQLGAIGAGLGTVGIGAGASSDGMRGGVSVNPGALAGYDLTAGISANRTAQSAAIAQNARAAAAASSITATGDIRDTNVGLARFAAKGDYQNAIAGIQSKLQDARLNQPSVSGQFNGDAMNLAHNRSEYSARWKLIDKSALRRIGNFWLRYGYAIEQFLTIPSNFMCMTKFTYWKMQEAYIVKGNIPEASKSTIRGIFEKGVTVWANPDDIGAISLSDNQPLNGISY
jgi:hypothetical protein